ncbi:flagellin [Oceanobacter antarcticus]|uniref:Flagellin n=1 Tax=Oceanobacter antarcticus TaxID=3133425 RepID=A0ABW8NLN5_9GAMM
MPQIINTNIASLNAQRNLDKSQSANQQALERLSSGLRINSAKDDAAGLAISTRFTSQIKGLGVAVRNAGDGIALAQTAEGALGSVNENLQRIRELAVQSANSTNSDVDREALQAEVDQLVAEITRTSEETDFNGRKLLDGSFSATFQIGANAGQTVDVSIAELTADKLGVGQANGVSALGNENGLRSGDLIINGTAIDPSRSGDDTSSVSGREASAIAKVAAINAKSDETGVTAEVNTNVASGSEMVAGQASGTMTLNGVDISLATGGLDTSADRDSVISSINAKSDQTGVVATDGGDGGGVTLEAKDGRNITVDLGTSGNLTEAATGLSSGTSYGGFTLISQDGSDIEVEGGQGTGTGDIRNSGLTAGTYSGRAAAITSTVTTSSISSAESAATFTTADMSIAAGTAVNATNNTFELNVNNSGFQTLTLDSSYDPSANGGTGSVGTYDNAEDLALHINNAIANDANFQDADGNALVAASANDDGSLTFTTTEVGADANVVARSGSANMDIATATSETSGTDGGNYAQSKMDFIFDGVNSIAGGNTVRLGLTGSGTGSVAAAAGTDLTLSAGTYTTAQSFADELNSQIAGNASLAGKVEAAVSEDGKSVLLNAVLADTGTNSITAIDVDAASTTVTTLVNENVEHLANGDAVITDVAAFNTATAGAADTIGVNVDGAGLQDLDLSTATGGIAAITDADTLAAAINEVAANSLSGAGITATVTGGQVVISSNSGGSVEIGAAATPAETVGGAAAAISDTTQADVVVTAEAGTATTGSFNVDADGNFLSGDPDGAGTDYDASAAPLVVSAGENDTFSVAIDGAAAQDVTIAAGSYNSLSELATAIDSGYADAASTIEVADLSGTVASDYDFATGGATDDLAIAISLDGGAAQTITINSDHEGADVAESQANLLTDLQSQLDTAFGTGKVLAEINNDKLEISRVGGQDAGSVALTIADTGVGDAGAITTTASGTTVPAMTVGVSADNSSLVFTSGSTGASSEVDVTNGTFAIEGGFVSGSEVTQAVTPNAMENGDLVINGTSIQGANARDDTASDTVALTSDAAAGGIAVAAAINKSSAETGVTAEVNATTMNGGGDTSLLDKAAAGSTGTVIINNVETTAINLTGDEGRDRQTAIDAINSVSGQTGVMAEDNGESITLTAADGRNISVAIDNKASTNAAAGFDSSNFGNAIGLSADEAGVGEADLSGTSSTYANTAGTTYSTVTLTSASAIEVSNGENGADELSALGLQAGTYGGGEDGQYLKDIDISTFEGAQSAIKSVDNAIEQVASQRADLGAIQNRLESTVSNLQVTSENLNAANSRIQDADFAAETAEMSRTQVLQQAGISVLAQANAAGQQVLSLLG